MLVFQIMQIPTGFTGIADSICVLKHPKFALNFALLVRHENFLRPKTGNLQEVSRESVHIYIAGIVLTGFVTTATKNDFQVVCYDDAIDILRVFYSRAAADGI